MPGYFYICATPIGNIKDITLRAIDVLKEADYIACEDTRVTRVLLEHYGIGAKLIDCHKFNEKEKSSKIISLLLEGKNVVLVSDAGTPLVSDPGSVLLHEIIKNDIKITAIPGACAVTTFLSLLPRDNEEFVFIGFIPRNLNQQIEILNKYKNTNCIFYESPQRLLKTLENIMVKFGENTKISVARELTKIHEEVKTGKVCEIIDYYKTNTLKGEIVVMIYGIEEKPTDETEIIEKIIILKKEGYSTKDISKIISVLFGENKNKIYKMIEKYSEKN